MDRDFYNRHENLDEEKLDKAAKNCRKFGRCRLQPLQEYIACEAGISPHNGDAFSQGGGGGLNAKVLLKQMTSDDEWGNEFMLIDRHGHSVQVIAPGQVEQPISWLTASDVEKLSFPKKKKNCRPSIRTDIKNYLLLREQNPKQCSMTGEAAPLLVFYAWPRKSSRWHVYLILIRLFVRKNKNTEKFNAQNILLLI